MFSSRRVSARRDGSYAINFSEDERQVIRQMVQSLEDVVTDRSEVGWRLFPNPHPEDPKLAADYEDLVGSDLADSRRQALATVRSTVDDNRLDEDQLTAWMATLNNIRLVIGTRLELDEDTDPESFDNELDQYLYAVYTFFSIVVEEIVDALTR